MSVAIKVINGGSISFVDCGFNGVMIDAENTETLNVDSCHFFGLEAVKARNVQNVKGTNNSHNVILSGPQGWRVNPICTAVLVFLGGMYVRS